jgi:hypothetical protein
LLLPIVATFAALHFKNLYVAAAFTWAVLLSPFIVGLVMTGEFMPPLRQSLTTALFIGLLGEMALSLFIMDRLNRNLARRSYAPQT